MTNKLFIFIFIFLICNSVTALESSSTNYNSSQSLLSQGGQNISSNNYITYIVIGGTFMNTSSYNYSASLTFLHGIPEVLSVTVTGGGGPTITPMKGQLLKLVFARRLVVYVNIILLSLLVLIIILRRRIKRKKNKKLSSDNKNMKTFIKK